MTNPIQQNSRALGIDSAVDNRLKRAEEARASERAASARTAESAPAPRETDEVVLRGLSEAAERAPEIDSAKVEAIKTAIREGRYPVDAKAIAQHFMEFETAISRVA